MEIKINPNPEIAAFVRTLDDVARRQVPYATSRAINETLLFAQAQIRRELPEHFKIRSNWVAKGIQVRMSDKRTLTGLIFTRDDFMARQETGGSKPRSGKEQAIPFAVRGADGDQKTLKSRWPGQMIGKDRAFMVRSETSRVGLVLRRNGRGKRKNEVLYVLLGKAVKVKARWNFRKRVEEIANQIFPMLFKSELASAIASRRQ